MKRILRPDLVDVALALATGGSVLAASTPVLAAYRVPGTVVLLVAAAFGSTAVAFVSARVLKLSASLSYLVSVAGLAVLLLGSAGLHLSAIAVDAGRGPQRVLTETLPLAGGRAVLAAPLILVWFAGAATMEILSRRSGRAGATPAGLAVPVALYALLYAAASSAPGASSAGGPVVLVVTALAAALWMMAVNRPAETIEPGRPGGRIEVPDGEPVVHRYRPAATGLLASALVAAVLAVAAPHVPGLGRGRQGVYRHPPTVTPVVVDPLGAMADLRDSAGPPVTELRVTLSAPSDGYLAVAALDDYDGSEWRFSASFEPTGGRIPGAATQDIVDGTVGQSIVITGKLPVPLLPALDRPRDVAGVAVSADAESGMLVPQGRIGPTAYHVVSQTPDVSLSQLSPADGIAGAGAVADLELPPDTTSDLATAARYLATLTGTRPAAGVAFLQTALQALRARDRTIVPGSGPSASPTGTGRSRTTPTTLAVPASGGGTSLSEVINAVTVNRAATPEQFATFFAVIARYLGVPARVVTGFRLPATSGGSTMAPGTYPVTSRQAWAWVEIPVAGFGWVVADPTPDVTTAAGTPPPESAHVSATTLPPRGATVVPRGAGQGGHGLAPAAHPRIPRRPADHIWLYAGLSVLALIVLLLCAGPGQASARRLVRRRLRRRGDPPARAIGAWLELLDGAARAGMRPGPGATSAEVAAEIGHHFGSELAPVAAELGVVADRAVFSESDPPSADAADRAWELERRTRKSINVNLTGRQRVAALTRVGDAPRRAARSGPTRR